MAALNNPKGKKSTRLAAVRYLKETTDGVGNEILPSLSDNDAEIRTQAFSVWVPGQGSAETQPILREFIKHDDPEVRIAAIQKLEDLGEDNAGSFTPELMDAQSDRSGDVRREALVTLEWLGKDALTAVEAIVEVVLNDANRGIQELAAEAWRRSILSGTTLLPS